MKRIIPVIFVFTAFCIALYFITYKEKEPEQAQIVRPRTIIPAKKTDDSAHSQISNPQGEDAAPASFIPLRSNEILISALSIDFNMDGYDDQVNAIRRAGTPYIILLVGLYNPRSASYGRTAEINTGLTQAMSFTYTVMDIIGNHTNSLIYSGTAEDGAFIMKIYHEDSSGSQFRLKTIGDFRSDGTIFIQQLERYDSYDQNLSQGTSFPVWVYRSADSQSGETLDQLQIMYDWDPYAGTYVKKSETRVAGKKIAAEKLSRIQDGSVSTFAAFLNGIWYKISNTDEGIRYIFFDYEKKEIILLLDSTQEVYTWVDSNLRRNGISLSTVNATISNLTRLFDITLTDADEIKLTIQDDVRMPISESTLWDGQYKKLPMQQDLKHPAANSDTVLQTLTDSGAGWQLENGTDIHFTKNTYEAANAQRSDSGQIALITINGAEILQFKSDGDDPFFDGAYRATLHIDDTPNGETSAVVFLEQVDLGPDGFVSKHTRPIRLSKRQPPQHGPVKKEPAGLPE